MVLHNFLFLVVLSILLFVIPDGLSPCFICSATQLFSPSKYVSLCRPLDLLLSVRPVKVKLSFPHGVSQKFELLPSDSFQEIPYWPSFP